MLVWFSTLGWKPFAVINTIWHFCASESRFPDKIYLIKNDVEKINKHVPTVKKWLGKLMESYASEKKLNIEILDLRSDKIEDYAKLMKTALKLHIDRTGVEIIIDITPGKKYMSILLSNMAMQNKNRFQHVYYNDLFDERYMDTYFPLIPKEEYELVDMLDYFELLAPEMQEKKGDASSPAKPLKNKPGCAPRLAEIEKSNRMGTLSKDIFLTLDQLIIIVNELGALDTKEYMIEASPLGCEIFKMKKSGNFEVMRGPDISKMKSAPPRSIEKEFEISEYWYDLCKISGLVRPENTAEIEEQLQVLYNFNPLNGDLPPTICMDSNLFRYRLYTCFLQGALKKLRNHKIGFLLSEKVGDELANFDRKFRKEDIAGYAAYLEDNCASNSQSSKAWHLKTCEKMFNQLEHEQRLRRIGFDEYNKVKKREQYGTVISKKEGNSPDMEIISNLREHVRNNNIRSLFLSEDRDAIARAMGNANILTLLVKYPSPNSLNNSLRVDSYSISNLLFTSAIYFGGILVHMRTASNALEPLFMLQGIWSGKTADEWTNEKVKVWGNPQFLERVAKFVDILSAME